MPCVPENSPARSMPLSRLTGYYLAEGYRLETLIGTFAPKIGLCREITDAKDIKTHDVRFEGIEYKSVKSFEESVRNWLRGFRRANNPDTQEVACRHGAYRPCPPAESPRNRLHHRPPLRPIRQPHQILRSQATGGMVSGRHPPSAEDQARSAVHLYGSVRHALFNY